MIVQYKSRILKNRLGTFHEVFVDSEILKSKYNHSFSRKEMLIIKQFSKYFCEPHPSEYNSPWERQVLYEKHLGQTINHLLNFIFTFIVIPFMAGVPAMLHFLLASSIMALLLVSKYFWRWPRLHNFAFVIVLSAYSHVIVFIDPRGIFSVFAGLIGYLNCTHVATGSFLCVLIVGLTHTIGMVSYYGTAFEEVMNMMSPRDFYRNMVLTMLPKIAGAIGIALSREHTFHNTFKILR